MSHPTWNDRAINAVLFLLISNDLTYDFIISMGHKPSLTNALQKDVINLFLKDNVCGVNIIEHLKLDKDGYLSIREAMKQMIEGMDKETRDLFALSYCQTMGCLCINPLCGVNDCMLEMQSTGLPINNFGDAVSVNDMLRTWACFRTDRCTTCNSRTWIYQQFLKTSDFIIINLPPQLNDTETIMGKADSEMIVIGCSNYKLVGGISWERPDTFYTWTRMDESQWSVVDGKNTWESEFPDEIQHFLLLLYQFQFDD